MIAVEAWLKQRPLPEDGKNRCPESLIVPLVKPFVVSRGRGGSTGVVHTIQYDICPHVSSNAQRHVQHVKIHGRTIQNTLNTPTVSTTKVQLLK